MNIWFCVLLALAFLTPGNALSSSLLRQRPAAQRQQVRVTASSDAAFLLDLLHCMIAAGTSPQRALRQLSRVVSTTEAQALRMVAHGLDAGLPWSVVWHAAKQQGLSESLQEIERCLSFSVRTGTPLATIIRAEATRLRRERKAVLQEKAATLGVRLVAPLGLCALPAFMCWTIVPILLTLLPGVSLS